MSDWTFTIDELAAASGGTIVSRGEARRYVVTTDSRKAQAGDVFFALVGENFDGHHFIPRVLDLPHTAVVGTPAGLATLDPSHLAGHGVVAVADTTTALGDLAKFVRAHRPLPLVAVTGSSGKTTTRELIRCVLTAKYSRVFATRGNYNNLIGVPLTLMKLDEDFDAAVLELGMSFPGEIRRLADICTPEVRVITNVGRAHLDVLGDEDGVARAKGELFKTARPGDVLVVNLDDERVAKLPHPAGTRVVTFGRDPRAEVHLGGEQHNGSFEIHVPGRKVTGHLHLPGAHNRLNAAAAMAVAVALDIDLQAAADSLTLAEVPGMRMEVGQVRGITLINDTYNANPLSMKAGLLTSLELKQPPHRCFVALADMLELGPLSDISHRELGEQVAQVGIDQVWLTGPHREVVAEGARQAGMNPAHIHCFDTPALLGVDLSRVLEAGDVVLVKGSRGMKMEQVVTILRDATSPVQG